MRALLIAPGPESRALVHHLREQGLDVVSCPDAREGRDAQKKGRFHLAVLDWDRLVDPRGLVESLRAGPDGERLVVVAFGSDRVEMLAAGAETAAENEPQLLELAVAGAVRLVRDRAAYEAMRRSTLQYGKALDAVAMGVTISDVDGVIRYANPAEAAMHGYRHGDLAGQHVGVLSPRASWKPMSPDKVRRLKPWKRDGVNLRKDGTIFPVRLLSDVVLDDQDAPIAVVTTCEDMTDRWRSDIRRTLLRNANRIAAEARSFAEAAPLFLRAVYQGVGWEIGEIWGRDREGGPPRREARWAAPGCEEEGERIASFGDEAPDGLLDRALAGQTVWFSPEDADKDPLALRAAEAGFPSSLAFPIVQGRKVLGAMRFFARAPEPPDEDLLLVMAEVSRNVGSVAARAGVEAELRALETRYKLLVESSRDLLADLSSEGEILSLNPAFETITGFPRAAFLGRKIDDLVEPADHWAVRLLFEAMEGARSAPLAEVRLGTKAGPPATIELSMAPVHGSEGVARFSLSGRDVSERKAQEAKEALRRAVVTLLSSLEEPTVALSSFMASLVASLGRDTGVLWRREGSRFRAAVCVPGEPSPGAPPSASGRLAEVVAGGSRFDVEVRDHEEWNVAAIPLFQEGRVAAVLEVAGRGRLGRDETALAAMTEIGSGVAGFLARFEKEEEARRNEERLSLALLGTLDGVWDWDVVRGTILFSPRWKEMLGYSDDEIGERPDEWFSRVHPEDQHELKRHLSNLVEGRSLRLEIEYRAAEKAGEYRWMLARAAAVRDAVGRASRVVGCQTDVTERKTRDPLTGLLHQQSFLDRLAQALERIGSEESSGVGVVRVDLHPPSELANADDLRVEAARRLRTCVRPADVVARLGTNAFAFLVEGSGDPSATDGVRRRVDAEFGEPFLVRGEAVPVTWSTGTATAATRARSAIELLDDAEPVESVARASRREESKPHLVLARGAEG